jgi:hypothetical protein
MGERVNPATSSRDQDEVPEDVVLARFWYFYMLSNIYLSSPNLSTYNVSAASQRGACIDRWFHSFHFPLWSIFHFGMRWIKGMNSSDSPD